MIIRQIKYHKMGLREALLSSITEPSPVLKPAKPRAPVC